MAFRVLVVGGRGRVDYARFRDALDRALANRLPEVQILTAGGPGVPALAASYARSRSLELVAVTPNFQKHPGDAVDRRAVDLVAAADAAVIVWEECNPDVAKFLALARSKGIPVLVLGAVEERKDEIVEVPEPTPRYRGLPD